MAGGLEAAGARHLTRLAAGPRGAGTAANAAAREYCSHVLTAEAFVLSEQSFEYSAFPGSWAAPLAAIAAAVGALGLFRGRESREVLLATVAGLAMVNAGLGALGGRGVLRFPMMRRRGVNLQAVRGDGIEPLVWLVAHLDSKWQPVSMIVRVAGVVVTVLAGLGLLAADVVPGIGERVAMALLVVAWLGSIPLMMSIVRNRSHGAVDNASGVATVLEAAAMISKSAPVGVVITDAEELALAGARAWAASRAAAGQRPAVALNCDSVDDRGRLTLMYSGRRPMEVVGAFQIAAASAATDLRIIRLLPGVLTDSVALASRGWKTATLSRGDVRTLQRIHTSRDTLEWMRGTGIKAAARLLADAATLLAEAEIARQATLAP